MKRAIILLLSVLLIWNNYCYALSEAAGSWVCPNCNKTIDTNFCPDCGAKRPDENQTNEKKDLPSDIDLTTNNLYITLGSWINGDYEEIKEILLANGFEYNGLAKEWEGKVYTFSTDIHPFDIALFDTDENDKIEMIEAAFAKNSRAYYVIYNSLESAFGHAVIYSQESYRSETARWKSSENIEYRISGDIWSVDDRKVKYDRCALSDLRYGKHFFQLLLLINDDPIVPQKTPAPTPQIESEIKVASARLNSSSVVPELFIVFTNLSNEAVDRIDFDIMCYDAYGFQIRGYDHYDYTSCFYDQTVYRNQSSRSDYRWYLNGWDGIKSVEIAITRYHKMNGEAVIIPEDQRKWVKFTFR